MDIHALSVLAAAESWDWPPVKRRIQQSELNNKLKALITPKLLSGFIGGSQAYPQSQLVDHFWLNIQKAHTGLRTSIQRLKTLPATVTLSQKETMQVLFEGINPKDVDFSSLFDFTAQLLAHLGIPSMFYEYYAPAVVYPFGVYDDLDPDDRPTELMLKSIDELLKKADEGGPWNRRQEIFKALAFKRDGFKCLLTNLRYDPCRPEKLIPVTTNILSSSLHDHPDTLNFIAMFAGPKVRDLVVKHLNGVRNIMNLQSDAAFGYHNLQWAIQAKEEENGKVTYIYRKLVDKDSPEPGYIKLKDGDEIPFGQGEGNIIEGIPGDLRPLPALCNLHYSLARILLASGTAGTIGRLKHDVDYPDYPYDVTSTECANRLKEKLLVKWDEPRS